MNAAKWAGLTLVLTAVLGVAVWTVAVSGTMADHAHQSPATQPMMGQTMGSGPNGQMASPQAGQGGFFAEMWSRCQGMWNQLAQGMSAIMGMISGGMHGHGSGMPHYGPPSHVPSALNE